MSQTLRTSCHLSRLPASSSLPAFGFKRHNESRTLADFALDTHTAAHQLDQRLADAQAQARPPVVHAAVLVKAAKVHEKLV